MRIHKTSLFLCMSLLLTALGGCKEQVPPSNTPAYYALHGIVNDGKTVNEITLFNERSSSQPKLRFPPNVLVSVNTPGTHDRKNPTQIRKGYAYGAEIDLDWTDEHKLKPRSSDHSRNFVRIIFYAGSDLRSVERAEDRLREIVKSSVSTIDKPEWGVREYVLVAPKTDKITQYDYVPFDQNFRAIDGARMWIGCQAGGSKLTNNEGPTECGGSFNYLDGLIVTYDYGSQLLPYWREIYQEILKFTDSVLVK